MDKVEVGECQFHVEADNCRPDDRTVIVEDADELQVNVQITPPPPIH